MDVSDGVLIYDGTCGFCSSAARWIVRRWPTGDAPRAIAWQELPDGFAADVSLGPEEFARAAWWVDDVGRVEGAGAVASSLIAAGGAWSIVGRTLRRQPFATGADLGYRLVARYRHRLPGGSPSCRV